MTTTDTRIQTTRAPVAYAPKLAVRIDGENPLHHLWDNNGTWWCHFTVHEPGHSSRRIRVSLKTGDIELACRRRDKVFARLGEGRGAA